jgi:hypothetical protein
MIVTGVRTEALTAMAADPSVWHPKTWSGFAYRPAVRTMLILNG